MDDRHRSSVLVTGGRGFIGRAVGKLLQRTGYRVVSLDNTPTNSGEDDHESVREILCDVTDVGGLRRVFEEQSISTIIHLAAILPTASQLEPLRATQLNVGGSVNLLEMARRFGIRRVVFGSSLSIYGTCPAEQVVSEADRTAPEDLYGAAKLYVERLGEAYRDSHNLEFVGLRIGRVVGPGAESVSSAWRSQIFELLDVRQPTEMTIPFVGSERVLLVHIDDVARMLATLLQVARPAFSVYNAPCESLVVADLKREVEALNSNLSVRLGERQAVGNPRLLNASRFENEFDFRAAPIGEQLKMAAAK